MEDETEARYAQALHINSMFLEVPPEELSQAFERSERIFNKLLVAHDGRDLPYTLFVLDMQEANAVAVPGGGVGLSIGLLRELDQEIALAMVMAHEIGHHEYRHALLRMGRGVVFGIIIGLVGDSSSLLSASSSIMESGHSRAHEREADEFALRLIHEVYGSTEGALGFFEMVYEEYGHEESAFAEFFATHPLTSERIKYLKELARELDQADN